MDLISFFSAIPKIALFFLLIVGGAIVAEIFYFSRRKEKPPVPEAGLPPAPPPASEPLGQIVAAPATPKYTTEVVSPVKKPRMPAKTLLAALFLILVIVSAPVTIMLIRQRQEVRKMAYPGQTCQADSDCSVGGEVCVGGKCVEGGCGECGKPSDCTTGYTCENTCCVASKPQCLPDGAGCAGPGQTNESCCSTICNYGTCRGNTPTDGCGGLDEPACWSHGVYCAWQNGSCVPKPPGPTASGTGNVTCSAGKGSVSAKNNTNAAISGSYFIAKCAGDSCMCGGQSTGFTLGPGESKSWSGDVGGCGSWQTDISAGDCNASDSGCNDCTTGTPPPSTPPPQFSALCQIAKICDTNWIPISNLSSLTVGQSVFLTTHGSTNEPQGFTKGRFRINDTADASWCTGSGNTIVDGWCETTNRHAGDFFVQFTIANANSYKVESMVFNPAFGWK